MNKFINYVKFHKIRASIVVATLVVVGYFSFFRTSQAQVQYAVAPVEKGTLIVSISGSGQISSSNQVDIKPKVSGSVTYVAPLITGQYVGAGTLIASIDSKDAQKAVRDAQLNLQVVQLALAKLRNDQAGNQISSNDSLTNTQVNLTKAYQDGFNAVGTSFIHLPSVLNDANLALYGTQLSSYGCQPDFCAYDNLIDIGDRENFDVLVAGAKTDYSIASTSYNISLKNYKNTSRTADPDSIEALIDQTLTASQDLSQTIKSETTLFETLVADIQKRQGKTVPVAVTNYQSALLSDLSTINSQVSTLLLIQNTITTSKQSLASSQRGAASNEQGDSINLQTQENTVAQRQAALNDAWTTLADYSIRAPFSGILATLDVKRGDSASVATSMATVISAQQIAEISLNEVDVAKVKNGQKAILTFDAVPDLSLTGKVISVDVIGTVSQNVVSYKVKIALDAQDSRVKPGMSVSVSIITQAKQDVLMIPSSSVKSQGGNSVVQTVLLPANSNLTATITAAEAKASLQSVPIEVGVSNDTSIEVISGLKEGDEVVVRTISATAAKTTTTTTTNTNRGSGGAGVIRF